MAISVGIFVLILHFYGRRYHEMNHSLYSAALKL